MAPDSWDHSGHETTQEFCLPSRAQALRPYWGYLLFWKSPWRLLWGFGLLLAQVFGLPVGVDFLGSARDH